MKVQRIQSISEIDVAIGCNWMLLVSSKCHKSMRRMRKMPKNTSCASSKFHLIHWKKRAAKASSTAVVTCASVAPSRPNCKLPANTTCDSTIPGAPSLQLSIKNVSIEKENAQKIYSGCAAALLATPQQAAKQHQVPAQGNSKFHASLEFVTPPTLLNSYNLLIQTPNPAIEISLQTWVSPCQSLHSRLTRPQQLSTASSI